VETFKHLGVTFSSNGKQNKKIDIRTTKAKAVKFERYRSVA